MSEAKTRRTRSSGAVTMSDVAQHAGVALGTVSKVLNRPDHVTPVILERVRASIIELGFVRNRAAISLAAGVSNTVAFVLVDLANSYFTDMSRGAEQCATEAGKYLVLANSDIAPEKQRSYIEYFDEEQVAGVLLAPVGENMLGIDRLDRSHRPVVVLDASPDLTGRCAVSADNRLAGRLAAQHLLERGCRHIAFVGGPLEQSRPVADRYLGAREAVAEAPGATFEHISSPGVVVDDGRHVGNILSDRPAAALPDGVVAAADLLALGLVQAILNRTEYRFPDDIALIACDDNRSANDSVVPISTINLPGHEMGRAGMTLLLEELADGAAHVHRHVTLAPSLTARESTLGRHLG
ncbi:LacI family transcriptional regulator [Microbacterium halimionae]|uniref:LacI family transcriptional regulator n=1 Tax=Microbacterium halimionae TaxID=1526413 RepID=A0A7W3PMK8_9MICO|nr:LacI family DNA-binding transcriptional regulator [Microbacterium halimionae]MBA8817181.1 LacI family transcriptional regulator [Microbacterium halimionae]NII94631.1 LacI family transcriptional regulator [Microbacterium halimionae]